MGRRTLFTLLIAVMVMASATPALAAVRGDGGISFSDCGFLGGKITITGPFEEDVGCAFPEGQWPFVPDASCGLFPVNQDDLRTPLPRNVTLDPFTIDPFCGRTVVRH